MNTGSALAVFSKRILPILQADRPSSCTECHLSGVELKDYIHSDQATTFASLINAGLIDPQKPDNSKILSFIRRKPKKQSLINDNVRKEEYEAFRAWIHVAVKDRDLLSSKALRKVGPSVPLAVVRHARRDRVMASFMDNVWTEVARCSGCHSPKHNQKQVKEHGEQVSWIKLGDPQATLRYLLKADLIDLKRPEKSLLILKPTMQVEHGGGQKMVIGDRTYRQFHKFISDYSATASGQYKSKAELPKRDDEISVATSMKSGIWLKLTGVPTRYDKQLLQVNVYRRQGKGWSKFRWATADRAVFGKGKLWQQTLSLTAPRGSARAKEIRRSEALPRDRYLIKVYVDAGNRLNKDALAGLGDSEFVGQVEVTTRWRRGYGRMTVARFPVKE